MKKNGQSAIKVIKYYMKMEVCLLFYKIHPIDTEFHTGLCPRFWEGYNDILKFQFHIWYRITIQYTWACRHQAALR